METPPQQIDIKAFARTQQMLVDNGMSDTAMERIRKAKLPLDIVNGKVVMIGDSLEAWLDRFITCHPDMLAMKDEVRLLSPIQDEVLITGETGTGKELIARALHGGRGAKNFIAINCAGLPDNLIESELFGHVRGAFTGADTPKIGLMQQAAGGTLFLDEIGELPIGVQAKLLRALQEKKVRKVGGLVDDEITCRIVAATHRNLKLMVKSSLFRMDLYARLSTFELHIMPLSERLADMPLILESLNGGTEFLKAIGARQDVIDLELNVRSLQKHVKRFKVLGKLPL
jgi:transcriptional regulator with PAS, ATPase and Fis domain